YTTRASFTLSTTSGPQPGPFGLCPPAHNPWSGGSRLNWFPLFASRWSAWLIPFQPLWAPPPTTDVPPGDGGGASIPLATGALLSSFAQLPNSVDTPAFGDDLARTAFLDRAARFTDPTRCRW